MRRNLENLRSKLVMVEFAYKNLKESKEKYYTRFGNIKRSRGDDSIKRDVEIQFFAEAFFFQVKSFLDMYIKNIVRKKYHFNKKRGKTEIYFNPEHLNKINPHTDFVKLLIKHWNEGNSNRKYSLKTFNKYRNYICHEAPLTWFSGQVNSTRFKWYMLPDSLNFRKPFTCRKQINLFELCDEVFKSLDEICSKFDSKTNYKFNE